MRTLTNLDLLDLWERGAVLHPVDRALLTLAAALPGEDYRTLAAWPLGRRNAALARLRRACFGQTLSGWVACPQCGERLEFRIDAESIFSDSSVAEQIVAEQFVIDGHAFRPLTSSDLAAIAAEPDEHSAALTLLRTCSLDECNFTEADAERIGEQLAQADPLAETLLDFHCAECGSQWHEPLDIAAWLWTEIEARARRLLHDVHVLASAYSWPQAEILSLSESRRALYMEMVQA